MPYSDRAPAELLGAAASGDAVRMRTSRALLAALAVALSLPAATACDGGPSNNPITPASSATVAQPTTGAQQQLDALPVDTWHSMAGYSRDEFGSGWRGQGNHCDTRETVLKQQGAGVVTNDECKATAGTWVSPYDGKTVTDASDLDIDHVVPLANAWRTGADGWTDEERSDFANDLTRPQLLAVTASQNRSKGDQDPSEWRPSDQRFWCEYAQDWVEVKAYWGLFVTAAEKAALEEMLRTC